MDTKNGSPTFYTWGFKFIHYSYNIHTCFPITVLLVMVNIKIDQLKIQCDAVMELIGIH